MSDGCCCTWVSYSLSLSSSRRDIFWLGENEDTAWLWKKGKDSGSQVAVRATLLGKYVAWRASSYSIIHRDMSLVNENVINLLVEGMPDFSCCSLVVRLRVSSMPSNTKSRAHTREEEIWLYLWCVGDLDPLTPRSINFKWNVHLKLMIRSAKVVDARKSFLAPAATKTRLIHMTGYKAKRSLF